MILGAISKPPEAGPSAGFYVGVPLLAIGAYVQHHKRPETLVYERAEETSVTDRTWSNVQSLAAGVPIKLVMTSGEIQGTFIAANAEQLVIRVKRGDFRVDRTNVKRVDQRLQGSNRGRNVDVGLGLGLAAGLLRGILNTVETGIGRAMLAMPFMVAGATSGATASSARWETVYRRN
jgi:hypothetical protein